MRGLIFDVLYLLLSFRFNKLVQVVRSSLKALLKAIKVFLKLYQTPHNNIGIGVVITYYCISCRFSFKYALFSKNGVSTQCLNVNLPLSQMKYLSEDNKNVQGSACRYLLDIEFQFSMLILMISNKNDDQKMLLISFKNSLIIHKQNTKKNHKRVVSLGYM